MELDQNGDSIPIDFGSTTFVGRDLGLSSGSSSSDRTISRQHVSFQFLHTSDDTVDTYDSARELLLSFEVIGKNPISVISKDGERKRIYKKSEKGILKSGDLISLSIKKPNYFSVKRREGRNEEVDSSVLDAVKRRERRTRQRRREAEEREKAEEAAGEDDVVWEGSIAEIGSSDVSEVDPVKEFGFLERGREFDRYPMHKIRHFKDWNWFLEDTRVVGSEDDEEDEASSIKLKGKNKHHKNMKGGEDDDEEWIVENEVEGNLASKAGSAKRPILSTRSKDRKKPHNDVQDSKKTAEKKFYSSEEDVDDEEDETLGGFVVGDDDVEEEEEENEEVLEEESEEQEEDDEDDEESDFD